MITVYIYIYREVDLLNDVSGCHRYSDASDMDLYRVFNEVREHVLSEIETQCNSPTQPISNDNPLLSHTRTSRLTRYINDLILLDGSHDHDQLCVPVPGAVEVKESWACVHKLLADEVQDRTQTFPERQREIILRLSNISLLNYVKASSVISPQVPVGLDLSITREQGIGESTVTVTSEGAVTVDMTALDSTDSEPQPPSLPLTATRSNQSEL